MSFIRSAVYMAAACPPLTINCNVRLHKIFVLLSPCEKKRHCPQLLQALSFKAFVLYGEKWRREHAARELQVEYPWWSCSNALACGKGAPRSFFQQFPPLMIQSLAGRFADVMPPAKPRLLKAHASARTRISVHAVQLDAVFLYIRDFKLIFAAGQF